MPRLLPEIGDRTGGPMNSSANRLPSLTGLRFPAAFLVFLFHAALPFAAVRLFADSTFAGGFAAATTQAGGVGVTFFFVLSGFVLTWSARAGDSPKAFWRRRFVKIYPNYVVAWVLAMLLFAGPQTPGWRALANLLMLQSWIPDFATNFSVDPPAWSLGVEAVFYAAFPLLIMLVRRIRPDRVKLWITGVIAGIMLTPLLTYLLVPAGTEVMPNAPTTSPLQYWVDYVLPLPRILDFALGILLARAVQLGRWRNIGMLWSGLLMIISYPIASVVPHLYGQRAVCIVPIALLIAATATADINGKFTPFRNRTMVWLGNISFAFYLMHYIVLAYARKLFGTDLFSTPVAIALLLSVLAVSILVSWALYTAVEHPLTRHWSKPRKRTPILNAPAPALSRG